MDNQYQVECRVSSNFRVFSFANGSLGSLCIAYTEYAKGEICEDIFLQRTVCMLTTHSNKRLLIMLKAPAWATLRSLLVTHI